MGFRTNALAVLIPSFFVEATLGFTAALPCRNRAYFRGVLDMAPLSNEEIFARTQQKQKETTIDDEAPPMLFDEDMLSDMQAALLLMEKRVQEGPGSLTALEVDQLEAQLNKITEEMVLNENSHKPQRPPPQHAPPAPQQQIPPTPVAPPPSSSSTTTSSDASAGPPKIDMDTPMDEGQVYDGTGGMGQARETANTYIIPGMEEMEPEEYRAALQKSVIDRQKVRRDSGVTGNRATWDYLNQLTGETGVLKEDVKGESKKEDKKKD